MQMIPLWSIEGGYHEEGVGQVEEEGGKVPKGADNVPLVPLPRDHSVVFHFIDCCP